MSSNSSKRDRRCINQLGRWKCHRWPWWAASKVSRLLWRSVLSVRRHERGFPAFECEKAFRICTCIEELDTGKFKFWQGRFWTSLLPDSQISFIVTLPRDWASTRPATSPSRDGNQSNYQPQSRYRSLKKRSSASGFVKMSAFCSVVLQ